MSKQYNKKSPLVLHILPYDGIGGAEFAARSLKAGEHEGLVFRRYYLARHTGARDETDVVHGPAANPNSPRAHLAALRYILREQPDLLVASLWRSALVLILARILRPRIRTVVFLHSPHDVHSLDWLSNRIAMHLSTEIWADSSETLRHRVPARLASKGRTVSFVTENVCLSSKTTTIGPSFVFWGRLHAQKNLVSALRIFARIADERPDARFVMIGPDGGERERLARVASDLRLDGKVSFKGAMDRADIFSEAIFASFYLQTSSSEGMAMSVVEAMQLGLVPVVTPVGEIARYCRHGENSIVIESDDQAAADVLDLLGNGDRYRRMAANARKSWEGRSLYRDDVLAGCRALVC